MSSDILVEPADNNRKPYSIGYVAKVTGISVSTLRAWEKSGLVDPYKSESGHRSFSAQDIQRVKLVEKLRRVEGQSLATIRKTLNDDPLQRDDDELHDGPERQRVKLDQVGAQVRAMRQEAGYSLRDLAKRAEIGVPHLSMFERGAAFLSPARLSAIAAVFGRSLAELLGGTTSEHLPVVRKGAGRIVGTFGPGVSIEQITVAERLMDIEIWTIVPGRESDGFYAHEGEELLFVLDGELEFQLAGRRPSTLRAGDSAYFSSRIDHRWKNTGDREAQILWVNTDTARLGAMTFEKRGAQLDLGSATGTGLGEGSLRIDLPGGAAFYRVIDTHTAGHPTRILIEPIRGLTGDSVAEKQASFEARLDHLRPLLLQEPRGHAGSFGLVPVQSKTADFGVFFITSYGYPRFCGHAIFGYAKALKALGRLTKTGSFTVEMPAATVSVHLDDKSDEISVILPKAEIIEPEWEIELAGRPTKVAVIDTGVRTAVVDADAVSLKLERTGLDALLAAGSAVRAQQKTRAPLRARNEATKATTADDAGADESRTRLLDQVLVFQSGREIDGQGQRPDRLFLAIDEHRYDRSPGVTGLAALITYKQAQGQLSAGETLVAESLFGGRLSGHASEIVETGDGRLTCTPIIRGHAHLNGISTLILEDRDPMKRGFLA